LHCRTNYSFLRGGSHPDELVQQAATLGYKALAITDCNTLAGVVRAHAAARECGLKLLIGAEITPRDAPPIILLATDRAAYGRLSRLLTCGKRRAPKGECELYFADVAEHAAGLIAVLPSPLGGEGAGVRGRAFTANPSPPAPLPQGERGAMDYRAVFGDRCYALAELHYGPDDSRLFEELRQRAKLANIPLAAANGVCFHVPERRFLFDVLTAVHEGCSVAELGDRILTNAERYLKSPQQMAALFAACPEAIARTVEVAERCTFSLDELRYEYPHELCPAGTTPIQHLTALTWEGARGHYPHGIPDKVRGLIEYELRLIAELRYEAYFLTVWDLVRFARSRDILCQGRGSAANSAVCFCLGVTSVDPDRIDVLFERFVSKERNEAPDIDVDFEHERREEVLQYIYEKYGRERAGMTAEVITYRPRSAVRDVGKALGLSLDRVDSLAKAVDHYSEEKLVARFREAGFDATSRLGRQLVTLLQQIPSFPRHLSQHVGGMVITQGPLSELVPIENAAMPDRTVIEWDKDDLDALGILKVDCLSLGMLTAIRKGFDLIKLHYGRELTLATVPAEDPLVYEMIQKADTVGVFQIESRAQMSMLPRLKPACFYDLVIEVAIVRPGPIQGNMVHPYLRRRSGQEAVEYPNETIRAVLEKTLGVPIFQEQAMRLAVVAAGFTPGEADQLRRAMGAWRKRGVIDAFRQKLINGMIGNGYDAEFAERLFMQIRGFGEYGFPESHAASFALLVYVSAWIKRHYPVVFAAAILNSQPMGFYAPAQLVGDARKHGVAVLPVDVNASAWDCTLVGPACRAGPALASEQSGNVDDLRKSPDAQGPFRQNGPTLLLGFRLITGLQQAHAEQIVRCREATPFTSFADFARRTGLSSAVLIRLAKADAFQSLGVTRRQALWLAYPGRDATPLFDQLETPEEAVPLPAMSPQQEVVADYTTVGLSLKNHPFAFLREQLDKLGAAPTSALAERPNGCQLKVGGLVLLRQRPSTAKGITFVTLEDETGFANLIVRQEVWERYRRVARSAAALLAHGELQRQGQIIHLLVDKLEDLSTLLADLQTRSRDFR